MRIALCRGWNPEVQCRGHDVQTACSLRNVPHIVNDRDDTDTRTAYARPLFGVKSRGRDTVASKATGVYARVQRQYLRRCFSGPMEWGIVMLA